MKVYDVRNVEEALIRGMKSIKDHGVLRPSRNGPVMVVPEPVTTVYRKPKERVIFLPDRDANPFFHFMESLWMVAGRADVEWISQFNSSFGQFSDDGVTFHGAYGRRWRNWFEVSEVDENGQIHKVGVIDQLATIAETLKKNKNDRRIVLQMWDASTDLGSLGKDFPCNVSVTFSVNYRDELDMTVFNRSNDMIWGAYGANAVHFSVLQEVMASWIGYPVGRYWQVSSNHHAYLETLNKHNSITSLSPGYSPYELDGITPFPIVNTDIDSWFSDLEMFMSEGDLAMGYVDPFFRKVAIPMLQAWKIWKDKDNPNRAGEAIKSAYSIQATDWQKACVEWLERRNK